MNGMKYVPWGNTYSIARSVAVTKVYRSRIAQHPTQTIGRAAIVVVKSFALQSIRKITPSNYIAVTADGNRSL
jgi:hypothetical protein